jgi:CTP synthase
MKTKPTQYAVRTLNSAGLQPDFIIARSSAPLDKKRKEKIAINCNMQEQDVISAPDIKTIYEVPVNFEKDKLSDLILKKLRIKSKHSDLKDWKKFVKIIGNKKSEVKIGVVGKYFSTGDFILSDAYISVIEAIKHAAYFLKKEPVIDWLNAETFEKNAAGLRSLKNYNGIIVPGGFGNRGVEGKIKAIEYCRKNKIPYLGLCLGMQLAVIEYARNVCGLKANSTEFEPKCEAPVIDVMSEQKAVLSEHKYGGTMRLGAYLCEIKPKTQAFKAYLGSDNSFTSKTRLYTTERHRHRYELNNAYKEALEQAGLVISGNNPERGLAEMIELPNHPFFMACQFHPEFKSRPLRPHPLFREFVRASIIYSKR